MPRVLPHVDRHGHRTVSRRLLGGGRFSATVAAAGCSDCKQPYHPDDEELIRLGIVPPRVRPTFYRGAGCPACPNRLSRRTGIFELLVLDDEIRRLIGNKADSASIRQAAMAKGMVTLKDEGAEKVFHGVTTTEELMRITQQEVEIDARLSL